jgi:hypothetical protein
MQIPIVVIRAALACLIVVPARGRGAGAADDRRKVGNPLEMRRAFVRHRDRAAGAVGRRLLLLVRHREAQRRYRGMEGQVQFQRERRRAECRHGATARTTPVLSFRRHGLERPVQSLPVGRQSAACRMGRAQRNPLWAAKQSDGFHKRSIHPTASAWRQRPALLQAQRRRVTASCRGADRLLASSAGHGAGARNARGPTSHISHGRGDGDAFTPPSNSASGSARPICALPGRCPWRIRPARTS